MLLCLHLESQPSFTGDSTVWHFCMFLFHRSKKGTCRIWLPPILATPQCRYHVWHCESDENRKLAGVFECLHVSNYLAVGTDLNLKVHLSSIFTSPIYEFFFVYLSLTSVLQLSFNPCLTPIWGNLSADIRDSRSGTGHKRRSAGAQRPSQTTPLSVHPKRVQDKKWLMICTNTQSHFPENITVWPVNNLKASLIKWKQLHALGNFFSCNLQSKNGEKRKQYAYLSLKHPAVLQNYFFRALRGILVLCEQIPFSLHDT